MSVKPARFQQMEREVARFQLAAEDREHNHAKALAELLQALRRAADPLDALRFMGAMLQSSYARRPAPRVAYGDVFQWLAQRLRVEPGVAAAEVAEEAGWLRRLVVVRQAAAPAAYGGRGAAPAAPGVDVAQQIASVEKARDAWRAAQRAAARAHPAPAAAPARAAPTSLPPRFEAEFVDLKAVRDARKTAKDREKAGKPRKVAWAALRPVDGSLAALAKGLACTLDTPGLDALMDDIARRDGRPRACWVSGLRPEGERLVVGEITLA